MKVVVIANAKGGVGKTTIAVNLAIRAACGQIPELDPGKRILICDMDSQQNASQALLDMETIGINDFLLAPVHPEYNPSEDFDWDGRSSSTDIYYGRDVMPYPTNYDKLDILPANGDHLQLFLNLTETVTDGALLSEISDHFRKFVSDDDVCEIYDLIVFDTPPGKSFITTPVFRAATDVLMPFTPEGFSVQGLKQMKRSIEKENAYREQPIHIAGLIPNLVKRNNRHKYHMAALREDPDTKALIFDRKLSDRTAFVLDNMPIQEAAYEFSDEKAEWEMAQFVKEIRERIFKRDIQ